MKQLLIIAALLFLPLAVLAGEKAKTKKANAETAAWRYEIQRVSSKNGAEVVCVWSYSKDVNIARKQAVKNAVHGVLFRGAPASGDEESLPPLLSDPSAEYSNASFFANFFADGGEYARYASITGAAHAGSVEKIGKEYRVAVNVTVNTVQLKSRLDGVIGNTKLGNIF